MDRLVQLRDPQRDNKISVPSKNVEDSVEDFYTYIPRHRGDFPSLDYQLADDPPRGTRYNIVDRIFKDDLPVYILRPQPDLDGRSSIKRKSSEVSLGPKSFNDCPETRQNGSEFVTRRRLSRCRTSPTLAQSSSSDSLAYDPCDPSLLHVDLSDVLSYVTPRELERYETFRFENPRPEDFPPVSSHSRDSSEVPRFERDQRALVREEIRSTDARKKPPKKRTKTVPSTTPNQIESDAQDAGKAESVLLPLRNVLPKESREVLNQGDTIEIIPSFEPEIVDVSKGHVQRSFQDEHALSSGDSDSQTTAATSKNRSIRSGKILDSSASIEPREQSSSDTKFQRWERNFKTLAEKLSTTPIRTSEVADGQRNISSVPIRTLAETSGSSIPSSSSFGTQSTIDSYLKAMSKAREAKRPPSFVQ
ncbi:uncharacterized protein PV09_08018 [Verruconis gallopava]|uniref:Uncharacterized protein n=1 Tax=Verruconis gallopava TaxID=253628 RepID=A0A0D2A1G6_9PEZI|nr:uncharacterized protein PV09_08018 [Verruconis gallopava]KIW00498.1 hypothetical protein PV09_08018 [Verruconis gallopava]